MKCWPGLRQTGSHWTGACGVKPRPASPNHVRSVLFWDIIQHRGVNSVPAFQDNLLVPASKVNKSKREKRAWPKLTDTIFFFGNSSVSKFLKTKDVLETSCFPLQEMAPLNWWIPQTMLFWITVHLRNSNLLTYVSSLRVVTRKWLLKN